MTDILYCDVCDIKLSSIYALRKHLKTNLHKKKLNPTAVFSCLCGKQYKHKQTLYGHRKYCDTYINRPTKEEQVENEKQEDNVGQEPLLRKIEYLEKKLLEKEIECLKKENESLKKIANTTKITNTTTNNNTNITNNITINAYGEENLDIVPIRNKIQSVMEVYNGVPYIFEILHCNPKHPENQNIKIKNKREKNVIVMGSDGKWKITQMEDAITDAVSKISNMIYDTYMEHKLSFKPFKRNSFEAYNSKLTDEYDKTVLQQVVKNTELILLQSKLK